MTEEPILTKVADKIATLTFNRPEKLNALNFELVECSIRQIETWSRDPEVGAIVITGAGSAFCAGGDISIIGSEQEMSKGFEQRVDELRKLHELSWLLYSIPKVTIAAVNGHAMGAGLGICLSCDLRVASERARFGTAFAKVGFSGDFGTTWLLTHHLGAPKAKELLFLADAMGAEDALRLGLVNRIVAHDALESTVGEIASRIANGPLISFRYMKANVNMSAEVDFRAMLDREAETQRRCAMTQDHREGVRAFLEKRPPRFIGQ